MNPFCRLLCRCAFSRSSASRKQRGSRSARAQSRCVGARLILSPHARLVSHKETSEWQLYTFNELACVVVRKFLYVESSTHCTTDHGDARHLQGPAEHVSPDGIAQRVRGGGRRRVLAWRPGARGSGGPRVRRRGCCSVVAIDLCCRLSWLSCTSVGCCASVLGWLSLFTLLFFVAC